MKYRVIHGETKKDVKYERKVQTGIFTENGLIRNSTFSFYTGIRKLK